MPVINPTQVPSDRIRAARALVDQGEYEPAEALLRAVMTDDGSTAELAAATALVGRIALERHLSSEPDTDACGDYLRSAFDAYAGPFRGDPGLRSHGAAAVVVQLRAERHGVALDNGLDVTAVATAIAESIDMEDRSTEPADLGIAAETHLALGNFNEALAYTIEYVHRSHADAEAIAARLRQIVTVWDLTEAEAPGRRIIPFLHAELLQRAGGRVDLHRGGGTAAGLRRLLKNKLYEAVLGPSYQNVQFLELARRRSESVALVQDATGHHWGSAVVVKPAGFVLDPTIDLAPKEVLVLTSAHVIGDTDGALSINDARIRFEHSPTDESYQIAEVVSRSAVEDLDFVLVRTEPPLIGHRAVPIARNATTASGQVGIIDHGTDGLALASFAGNETIGADAESLHYRSAVEHNSGGSPVMNERWELIGLHQSGGVPFRSDTDEQYASANKAIRIGAITEAATEIDLRDPSTVR